VIESLAFAVFIHVLLLNEVKKSAQGRWQFRLAE
jgi:hypothetical protein